MTLPPFPVDPGSLDLLMAAINPWEHGDPDARSSCVADLLEFMSQMGGSDTKAIAEVHDDGSDGGPSIVTMRDPMYHEHNVIEALVQEIRRLRVGQA